MADGMTLQEIGYQMGMSRQAVDQIIDRAFIKIRRRLAYRGIYSFDAHFVDEHLVPALRAGNRPRE